jgi:uncharacterized repeat protein (TIGR03803 family)
MAILIALCTGCTAAQQPMSPQSPAIPFDKQSGYAVLHSFTGSDGSQPMSDLLLYEGSFYGTTAKGGKSGDGTIYKMSLAGDVSLLHSFAGSTDGATPQGGLTNVDGTLYGTTTAGGNFRHAL